MTLLNIAPFVKDMTQVSSDALISLFFDLSTIFFQNNATHPRFPRGMQENYLKILLLLLEVITTLLQYQFDGTTSQKSQFLNYKFLVGDSNFIYTLIKKKYQFKQLMEGLQKEQRPTGDAKPVDSNREPSSVDSNQGPSSVDSSQERQYPAAFEQALQPIMHVLEYLTKQIVKVHVPPNGTSELSLDEKAIKPVLSSVSLVGVLSPIEKPISIRRFKMSQDIANWLTSFLYGLIYIHSDQPTLWTAARIKLFTVKAAPTE